MPTQPFCSIKLCLGSACYARGSRDILETLQAYIKTHGLEQQINLTGSLCEDKCRQGPVVTIDNTVYTEVSAESVVDLLKTHLNKN